MKFFKLTFLLLCMWRYTQSEGKSSKDGSDSVDWSLLETSTSKYTKAYSTVRIDTCDYSQLENYIKILQQNIENIQEDLSQQIKEINLDKHTQALKNTISDKLDIVPQLDAKLRNIEGNILPKSDQLKFYNDIRQCCKKIDDSKVCNKQNNKTQVCPVKFINCNHKLNCDGWIAIQRRINGKVDFYRNWSEYKTGFGDIDGEFFIGLDKLHTLTSTLEPVELLIQLLDFDYINKCARYDDFLVGSESENYKLIKVGNYAGNAGDSFSQHVGYGFTTKDRDNDIYAYVNCAILFTAAWWYEKCYFSNLNGKYYQHPTKYYNATVNNGGINWGTFRGYGYSLKSVQMLIRPRQVKSNYK